ncbi:creatininase family protein [Anderseniella sp. Alg231-50]|uniref:creatininase family protein n=1 Tax=Anderseniella sp. Alg231-50 TaxID=1922226 RepID=UPI00307BE66A
MKKLKPHPYWKDMPASLIADADCSDWIAVLPVAATEQHGPHLPASTDTDIARAMVAASVAILPRDVKVSFLPVEAVGASAEHGDTPGTVSRDPCELAEAWVGIAADLNINGIQKLVLVSSHGGNTPVCDMVIQRARIELGMLAVATSWSRFGYPDGLFSSDEVALGIHGGDIETSIMLAARPDTVDLAKAEDFPSLQQDMIGSMKHLRAYGPHRFGWMMHDLNSQGVTGNAGAATAEKGAAVIAHQSRGFIELLEDVKAFDPEHFRSG